MLSNVRPVVVIVMLEEPSKLAAPDVTPAIVIVRAVVSASAVCAVPTTVALILPLTVRSPVIVPSSLENVNIDALYRIGVDRELSQHAI